MLSNCGRMPEPTGFGVSQLKYKFIILSLLCCGSCLFLKSRLTNCACKCSNYVPVCCRYDSSSLPCLPGLGSRFLPEGLARVSWWQEAHQLPSCHYPVLLALLHYSCEGHHLCPVCLRVPTLLWHLYCPTLVHHDFLDCPLWDGLLYQQMGRDCVWHGGGHNLHFFLV